MALTQEQIDKYRTQYGLDKQSTTATPVVNSASNLSDRLAKLKAAATGDDRHLLTPSPVDPQSKPKGFLQNVGNLLTSSEQTLGKGLSTVDSNIPQQQADQTAQNTQNVSQLLKIYHSSTDPVQKEHLANALKAMGTDVTAGDINSGFDLTDKQVWGAAAGTALDVLGAASPTQGSIIKDTKALMGGAELADIAGNSGKLITKAANPITKTAAELAGKAGVEVVQPTAKTMGEKGLTLAKNLVPKSAEEKATQATWDMIKPELSKTELAQATKDGKIVSDGILGTVKHIPKGDEIKMIEIAKPYVSKVKNEFEAVANMRQGIIDEATNLRKGLDQSKSIWSQNNLKGAISSIEKPHMLSGDLEKAFDKTIKVVLDKASTAKKSLSGLLDVRQEFDKVVAKQYPNLYNGSESMNAIKTAIRDTRGAINDLIEKKLPQGMTVDGIPFKESLKKQSLLYDAIENVSSKAPKEGTNKITALVKKYPKTAAALKYSAAAAGGGEIIKHTGLLP